jgi:hypothetical protein
MFVENRLVEVERRFDFQNDWELSCELGRCAVSLYQRFGTEAIEHSIPVNEIKRGRRRLDGLCSIGPAEPQRTQDLLASLQGELSFGPAPLRRDPSGGVFFCGKEWFHFFCSLGLLDAIREDRFEAIYRYPYGNPVHQYLAALARRPENRRVVVSHLMNWLSRRNRATGSMPIVRNFAAYVLGMIEAHEAFELLGEALNDTGQDVALYSICALGKLRSRRHLPKLVELWLASSDDQKRLILG